MFLSKEGKIELIWDICDASWVLFILTFLLRWGSMDGSFLIIPFRFASSFSISPSTLFYSSDDDWRPLLTIIFDPGGGHCCFLGSRFRFLRVLCPFCGEEGAPALGCRNLYSTCEFFFILQCCSLSLGFLTEIYLSLSFRFRYDLFLFGLVKGLWSFRRTFFFLPFVLIIACHL